MASSSSVLNHLENRAEGLSKTQRTLARYVLANYQTVAFSTVSELARLSGVSRRQSCVLPDALGFEGYPAFQRELRRELSADLKASARHAADRPKATAYGFALLDRAPPRSSRIFPICENNLDEANLKAAAKMLRRANTFRRRCARQRIPRPSFVVCPR